MRLSVCLCVCLSVRMSVRPSVGPYLRQDGDPGPQVVQSDVGDVDSVDHDAAAGGLDQPEEGQGQGRLTRPCPPHNAHLPNRQEAA